MPLVVSSHSERKGIFFVAVLSEADSLFKPIVETIESDIDREHSKQRVSHIVSSREGSCRIEEDVGETEDGSLCDNKQSEEGNLRNPVVTVPEKEASEVRVLVDSKVSE